MLQDSDLSVAGGQSGAKESHFKRFTNWIHCQFFQSVVESASKLQVNGLKSWNWVLESRNESRWMFSSDWVWLGFECAVMVAGCEVVSLGFILRCSSSDAVVWVAAQMILDAEIFRFRMPGQDERASGSSRPGTSRWFDQLEIGRAETHRRPRH